VNIRSRRCAQTRRLSPTGIEEGLEGGEIVGRVVPQVDSMKVSSLPANSSPYTSTNCRPVGTGGKISFS